MNAPEPAPLALPTGRGWPRPTPRSARRAPAPSAATACKPRQATGRRRRRAASTFGRAPSASPSSSCRELLQHGVVARDHRRRRKSFRGRPSRHATSPRACRGSRECGAAHAAMASGVCGSTSSPSTPCLTMSRVPADAVATTGTPQRHRFDQHVAESFVVRAQREHVGAGDVLPRVAAESPATYTASLEAACSAICRRSARFELALPENEQAAPAPMREAIANASISSG